MFGLWSTTKTRWKYDGLTSLKYEILSDIKHSLYRRIKVKLEEPDPEKLRELTETSSWKKEKFKYNDTSYDDAYDNSLTNFLPKLAKLILNVN